MFIFQSAIETLKKYADFKGRASREEFWCFFAFLIITNALASLVGLLLGFGPALAGIIGLLLIIPQLSVAVRRLHDLGKSGRELVVPCVICWQYRSPSPSAASCRRLSRSASWASRCSCSPTC